MRELHDERRTGRDGAQCGMNPLRGGMETTIRKSLEDTADKKGSEFCGLGDRYCPKKKNEGEKEEEEARWWCRGVFSFSWKVFCHGGLPIFRLGSGSSLMTQQDVLVSSWMLGGLDHARLFRDPGTEAGQRRGCEYEWKYEYESTH